MNNKKQANAKPTAIHTIRVGEVVAEIHSKTSNSGYPYLAYSLQRSYITSTGKQNCGSNFFATNEHDLLEAVRAASAWIRAKVNAAPPVDAPTGQPAGDQ
jgi:hypothetical protein